MEVDSNFHIKELQQVNNEPIQTETKKTNERQSAIYKNSITFSDFTTDMGI